MIDTKMIRYCILLHYFPGWPSQYFTVLRNTNTTANTCWFWCRPPSVTVSFISLDHKYHHYPPSSPPCIERRLLTFQNNHQNTFESKMSNNARYWSYSQAILDQINFYTAGLQGWKTSSPLSPRICEMVYVVWISIYMWNNFKFLILAVSHSCP